MEDTIIEQGTAGVLPAGYRDLFDLCFFPQHQVFVVLQQPVAAEKTAVSGRKARTAPLISLIALPLLSANDEPVSAA